MWYKNKEWDKLEMRELRIVFSELIHAFQQLYNIYHCQDPEGGCELTWRLWRIKQSGEIELEHASISSPDDFVNVLLQDTFRLLDYDMESRLIGRIGLPALLTDGLNPGGMPPDDGEGEDEDDERTLYARFVDESTDAYVTPVTIQEAIGAPPELGNSIQTSYQRLRYWADFLDYFETVLWLPIPRTIELQKVGPVVIQRVPGYQYYFVWRKQRDLWNGVVACSPDSEEPEYPGLDETGNERDRWMGYMSVINTTPNPDTLTGVAYGRNQSVETEFNTYWIAGVPVDGAWIVHANIYPNSPTCLEYTGLDEFALELQGQTHYLDAGAVPSGGVVVWPHDWTDRTGLAPGETPTPLKLRYTASEAFPWQCHGASCCYVYENNYGVFLCWGPDYYTPQRTPAYIKARQSYQVTNICGLLDHKAEE